MEFEEFITFQSCLFFHKKIYLAMQSINRYLRSDTSTFYIVFLQFETRFQRMKDWHCHMKLKKYLPSAT